MVFNTDKIVLVPNDIDLRFSKVSREVGEDTFVLGAFNPGFNRLPNGNLIMMVRIAEALKEPIVNGRIHAIRWDEKIGFCLDSYPINEVDTNDPRKFSLKKYKLFSVNALTSISWLLPVEISGDGLELVKIHYDKAIFPDRSSQEYGIEDGRISKIEDKYYMTTCSVSSERQGTTLYSSSNGLDYKFEGLILDHQNKDMLLFEGKVNNMYYALTRPLGSLYFATVPDSRYNPGPTINIAQSPDLLHWKPGDTPFIRPSVSGHSTMKIGGGAQPVLTEYGWLVIYHGVEAKEEVGVYRTFMALLDKDKPWQVIFIEEIEPVLEARPELTAHIKNQIYLEDVVFTTGIIDSGENFIVASGELDLCCRITHIPKDFIIQKIRNNLKQRE